MVVVGVGGWGVAEGAQKSRKWKDPRIAADATSPGRLFQSSLWLLCEEGVVGSVFALNEK